MGKKRSEIAHTFDHYSEVMGSLLPSEIDFYANN